MLYFNKLINMKNILAALGVVALLLSTILLTTALTSPTPSSNGTLTYVTSRDGIKVYKIGDFIVVKTDNSVSVSR